MPSTTLRLAARIVASYVSANELAADGIPGLLAATKAALDAAATRRPAPEAPEAPVARVPAVPIGKSVARDWIVCLEDGRKLTMLKRYLASRYGLTPAEYRTRWGLPDDYPMVAPAYAERRSELARAAGLGRRRRG